MSTKKRPGWIGAAFAATWLCAIPSFAQVRAVSVTGGQVEGVLAQGVVSFKGIPFAAPPVGDLRWHSPQAVRAWSGVRKADHFAASCWQTVAPRGFGPWTHEYVVQGPVSEDCLYLNIWTPARRGSHLPVLLYIHGGAFLQGSGSVSVYDGSTLALRGVVVVTVNYRLGALGFLAHPELTREAHSAPPGNYGLQDLIAALRWLRGNVAAFGGDPASITIDGQSAGAIAVFDLIASPLASGLFARAIAQSGGGARPNGLSLAQAEHIGQVFARSRGATSIAALRALTPEQLSASRQGPNPQFSPILDGVLLPSSPGPLNDTPILMGVLADEDSYEDTFGQASPTALKTLLRKIYGGMAPVFEKLYPTSTPEERASAALQIPRDLLLGPFDDWTRTLLAEGRQPVYGYYFDHIEPGPQSARYRVFHGSEIPYIFGTLGAAPERSFAARDYRISSELSRYWVSFVKTGNPNTPGLPYWPRMRLPNPQLMELGNTTRLRPILPADKLRAMERAFAERGEQK